LTLLAIATPRARLVPILKPNNFFAFWDRRTFRGIIGKRSEWMRHEVMRDSEKVGGDFREDCEYWKFGQRNRRALEVIICEK
jgi:hypothetical protein